MAGVMKAFKQGGYSSLLRSCVSWGLAVGFPANYLPRCENYIQDLCKIQLELLTELLPSLCSPGSPHLTCVPVIYGRSLCHLKGDFFSGLSGVAGIPDCLAV